MPKKRQPNEVKHVGGDLQSLSGKFLVEAVCDVQRGLTNHLVRKVRRGMDVLMQFLPQTLVVISNMTLVVCKWKHIPEYRFKTSVPIEDPFVILQPRELVIRRSAGRGPRLIGSKRVILREIGSEYGLPHKAKPA